MKKKLLFFAAIVVVLVAIACVSVSAAEIASGTCGADGDNLTWVLDDAEMLTIYGDGDMADWDSGNAPWYSYRSTITMVVIEDGVTSIGNYAFSECLNLETINYTGTDAEWDAITKGTDWDRETGRDTAKGTYELVIVYRITNLGASIRPETNEYSAGLRFGANFKKADFGIEGTYAYEGADVTFGMLLIPEFELENAGYTSVKDYYKNCETQKTLDVPAKKIYAQDETSVTYTVVLLNIPEKDYDSVICALPYAVVDGEYLFGYEMKTSFYRVAEIARETAYSDEAIAAIVDEKKKAEARAMAAELDKIIEIVKKQKKTNNLKQWLDKWN